MTFPMSRVLKALSFVLILGGCGVTQDMDLAGCVVTSETEVSFDGVDLGFSSDELMAGLGERRWTATWVAPADSSDEVFGELYTGSTIASLLITTTYGDGAPRLVTYEEGVDCEDSGPVLVVPALTWITDPDGTLVAEGAGEVWARSTEDDGVRFVFGRILLSTVPSDILAEGSRRTPSYAEADRVFVLSGGSLLSEMQLSLSVASSNATTALAMAELTPGGG